MKKYERNTWTPKKYKQQTEEYIEELKLIKEENKLPIIIPPSLLFYEYKPWYSWVYGGERNPILFPPPVQEIEDANPTP